MEPPEKVTKSREASERIIFQAQFALCRLRANVRDHPYTAHKSIWRVLQGLNEPQRNSGSGAMVIIGTGLNISPEMSYFRWSPRRNKLIPTSFNMALLHPRLLQLYVNRMLCMLDRSKIAMNPDSRKPYKDALVLPNGRADSLNALLGKISMCMPKLNTEQVRAIGMVVSWCAEMKNTDEDTVAQTERFRRIQGYGIGADEMAFCGGMVFFIRGPPGTGKSSLISWLVAVAVRGASLREGRRSRKVLHPSMRPVLVITHTNAAIDDIMQKVIATDQYEEGAEKHPLVRVGVRGGNAFTASRTVQEILRTQASRNRSSRFQSTKRSKRAPASASAIIDDAEVVFSTIGSLQRPEFMGAIRRYDMVVVEEAAKIRDVELLAAMSIALGGKEFPAPGTPVVLVLVGDEWQLSPFRGYDERLNRNLICKETLFERYAKSYIPFSSAFDNCAPISLHRQHRAHPAVAAVYSHFAYGGALTTGFRSPGRTWIREKMGDIMKKSPLNLRPVSVLQYRGGEHPDVRESRLSEGGVHNPFETQVVLSLCRT